MSYILIIIFCTTSRSLLEILSLYVHAWTFLVWKPNGHQSWSQLETIEWTKHETCMIYKQKNIIICICRYGPYGLGASYTSSTVPLKQLGFWIRTFHVAKEPTRWSVCFHFSFTILIKNLKGQIILPQFHYTLLGYCYWVGTYQSYAFLMNNVAWWYYKFVEFPC